MISTDICGKLCHQSEKQILGDTQRDGLCGCLHCGGTGHITQDGDFADKVIAPQSRHFDLTFAGFDQNGSSPFDNDIGRIPDIALPKQHLISFIGDSLRGERQQLELGGLQFGKKRNVPQQLDFFVQAHVISLLAAFSGHLSRHHLALCCFQQAAQGGSILVQFLKGALFGKAPIIEVR